MPNFRYLSLGPLPSPGASRAFLGLVIRDESRAEPIVLVWVPSELAQDVEKSDRIQRETERAALLEHPHIIRVYGFARMEDGRLARVVEFGDGENLRRVLDATGPLPAPLAARLIADAAQGVHYAHLAGNDDGTPLIHGDLRPETLLVTYAGNCKVAGYGASAFAPRENRARNIRVAPEQVLGGRGAMNVQTDVYLLGATLFEALTGKAPFEDAGDVDQAVLSKELDFARHPEIPTALVPVLARAMAKKAADRFASALLLREALELAVQPLPGEPEVATWIGGHFPDPEGARAARQRLIDAGIAAFARAQWAKQPAVPSTRSAFPTVLPPPPELGVTQRSFTPSAPTAAVTAAPTAPQQTFKAPPPPAPASAAANRQTRSTGAEITEEPSVVTRIPKRRSPLPVILVALAALGGGVVYLLSQRSATNQTGAVIAPVPPLAAQTPPDAGSAAQVIAATPQDASVSVADLSDAGGAQLADAGTAAVAAAPGTDGGAATATGTLSVTSEPIATVEIDGTARGRTPLRVTLPVGKRRVRLLDRSQGVDIARVVNVTENGTASESFYLQKGFVSVSAPVGALVDIDGKRVGKAPITSEISVYEGSHRIEVTIGTAKWREAFTVKPNQRVYFDVGPQYQ